MTYKISKYGNIIKVDDGIITLIPMDDSSSLYQEYLQFLTAGGTVEPSNLFTEEEELEFNTPSEVALWKLRFVLSQMQLADSITDAMNQLPEPQKTASNYIWNYGNSIDRQSSTISFIQTALGLTDNQVNNIYIQANSLRL
jgi:hypothetical protein